MKILGTASHLRVALVVVCTIGVSARMLAEDASLKPEIQAATIVYTTNPNQITIQGARFGGATPKVVLDATSLQVLNVHLVRRGGCSATESAAGLLRT